MITTKLTIAEYELIDIRAKYGLRYSAPIFFGPPPEVASDAEIRNGSVTLFQKNGQKFGITNWHVIEKFREYRSAGISPVCMVGNVEIDPLAILIDESKWYDLATLDFSDVDASKIRGNKEIPCDYFVPSHWPPEIPKLGDFLMFGGFPLSRRQRHSINEIMFGSASSGGSEVHSVQEDVVTCQLQLEQCVLAFDRSGTGFPALPGISGGPVLRTRRLPTGIEIFELVGIVFDDGNSYDTLRLRPISLVLDDGKIAIPPVIGIVNNPYAN